MLTMRGEGCGTEGPSGARGVHVQATRAHLAVLQRSHPALQLAQGGVLSDSLAKATLVLNHGRFLCTCGAAPPSAPPASRAENRQLLSGAVAVSVTRGGPGTVSLRRQRGRRRAVAVGGSVALADEAPQPVWMQAWAAEGLVRLVRVAHSYASAS